MGIVGRKAVLMFVILSVLTIANMHTLVELLEKHDLIDMAKNVVATCLTGGTVVILLAFVWLIPNREEW